MRRENYRSIIYDRYEEVWPGRGESFNEKNALRHGRQYRRLLRGLLPENKEARILDMGCGPGVLLFNLRQFGYVNLAGVERSPTQSRIARRVCDDVAHEDVFDYLSGRDESFDLIIGRDFIEHFTKDEILSLLSLCYSSLKPKGRLILQTVNADSPMALSCRYTDFTHEIAVNPTCLQNILTLTGFCEYEARESGPTPYGFISSIRFLLWQLIRLGYWSYDMIEVGGTPFNIYTRNFIATAVKPNVRRSD